MSFDMENNYEFYCFVKVNLPARYKIISYPSPNYYSEWFFDYKLFYNNKIVEEIKGNFNELKKGELIVKANDILNKYK